MGHVNGEDLGTGSRDKADFGRQSLRSIVCKSSCE